MQKMTEVVVDVVAVPSYDKRSIRGVSCYVNYLTKQAVQ